MKNNEKNTYPFTVSPGETVNLDYHHGGLRPAPGVHSFQVLRANRVAPEEAEGTGWTYNHAPMMAYWNDRFFLSYLSNPEQEHVAPGHTLLMHSEDGRRWSRPEVIFPVYDINRGGNPELSTHEEPIPEQAIMHQRMGFHVAPDGRLLALGFYGFSPRRDLLPFDRRGIGRVVREIYPDLSWGPIHFIHLNEHAGWTEENVNYPFYTRSDDPGFIEACDSLRNDALLAQQWKEEHGDADEKVKLKGSYKALTFYTLPDGRHAAFWKWCLAGLTSDRGQSWDWVGEVPGLENAGGKIWAQRMAEDSYALVYNPSTNNKHRWPLAMTTSRDGLSFEGLYLVESEVPPFRYAGSPFKDFGQNYVRGIIEGNGTPPDGGLWVAYSMNKEDIWVTRIPMPVTLPEGKTLEEEFSGLPAGPDVPGWNTYSPLWAPVSIAPHPGSGEHCLLLEDGEPHDYARAERLFPSWEVMTADICVQADRTDGEPLYIELWDRNGKIPVRVYFDVDGVFRTAHGRKEDDLFRYEAGRWYRITIGVDGRRKRFSIAIDGQPLGVGQNYQGEKMREANWYFRAPAGPVERLVLRTGPLRHYPHLDISVATVGDLPDTGRRNEPTRYFVRSVKLAEKET